MKRVRATGHVLLLGITGGVGEAVARNLGEAGFSVIGACRTAAQARQLTANRACAQTLRMSLDRPASIAAAFLELESRGIPELAAIVNCAAITQPKPLELSSMDEIRRSFEVNVFGALDVIQRALPLLRPAAGRIVLVSSTSGSVGVPLLGAYSASKFALEALADVLRRELSAWKIGVSLVIPGGIKTAMIERQLAGIEVDLKNLRSPVETGYESQYRQHRTLIELADKSAVSPNRVADDVLRALTDAAPKARYLCGLPSQGTRTLRRLLPDSIIDQLFDYLPESKK